MILRKKQSISSHKVLFCLFLLLPILFSSAEVNTFLIVAVLALLGIENRLSFSNKVIMLLLPLFVIIAIALVSAFAYGFKFYDFIKDFFYFLKPIIFVASGYYLFSKIKSKNFIFQAIIYLALLTAVIHLVTVFSYLISEPFNMNLIRYIGGKSNGLELLALILLIVNKKGRYFDFNVKYKRLIFFILIVSFFFYFSRMMLVAFFIFIFAINGYLKVNKKGLLYIMLFLITFLSFYIIINLIPLERGAPGVEGFLYKLRMAPSEIFSTEIDRSDHKELWDQWRGYEATKAIEQLWDTKFHSGVIFGKGFGSLVDLEFVAPLSNIEAQFIPKIHNGYINIMFKSGFVGLLFYLSFLFYSYSISYYNTIDKTLIFANNFISGIAIYFIFTSLIISGIYNQGDIFTFILGTLLFLRHISINQQ